VLCWGVGSDFNIADRGVGEVLKATVGVGRVDFPESGWDHSASNTSLGFERIHPPSAIHTPRTPRANLIRRTVIHRNGTISHCIGAKGRDAQTGACFDVEHSVGAAVGWGAGAGEGLGGCVGDGGGRG